MKIKNLSRNIFIDLSIVSIIFILDRVSKIFVLNLNQNSFSNEIYSSKFLNIRLFWNDGIAFGLFSSNELNFYNILTFIIIFVILVIFYMTTKNKGLKKYSLLMILGGALGNVFDRILYKSVPDFIDFHIGEFHWFIFNVADIFITIGVIFMILTELIVSNERER
tara:strand:+ start:516 stop:1010 length:495 start_codon:yes stop_codon:yes gene_type:complete